MTRLVLLCGCTSEYFDVGFKRGSKLNFPPKFPGKLTLMTLAISLIRNTQARLLSQGCGEMMHPFSKNSCHNLPGIANVRINSHHFRLSTTFPVDVSPAHALRGAFVRLRDKNFLETQRDCMVELLRKSLNANQSTSATSTQETLQAEHNKDYSVRRNFRRRLATEFFRRGHTRTLRMGFVLANYCSVRQ